jgi:RNA recognition motif-containing protein
MNIYVGNLSLDITKEELKHQFMAFGEVTAITIMNDKYIGSGQPAGYGFVEMASIADGTNAIQNLNHSMLKGLVIDVVEALPLSDKRNALPLKAIGSKWCKRQGRKR